MSDIFGGEGAEFEQEVVRDAPEPVEQKRVEPEPVAKEPEAKPDIGDEVKVPLAALNESRAQLRHTQAELQDMRQKMQALEAMKAEIDEFRNRNKQQQQEQEFNADPLGVIQKQLRELESKVSQPQQQAQQAQSEQQLFHNIASQVQEFKKATPDYDDALQHVLEARKQELMAMGAPEYEATQRISVEAQEIALNALRTGQNPGQVVYQLAKLRGYAAKQTATKLETVAKGQAVSQSLSGASGSTDKGELSLAEIDSMSDKEFDTWWAKNMGSNAR